MLLRTELAHSGHAQSMESMGGDKGDLGVRAGEGSHKFLIEAGHGRKYPCGASMEKPIETKRVGKSDWRKKRRGASKFKGGPPGDMPTLGWAGFLGSVGPTLEAFRAEEIRTVKKIM